MNISGIRPSVGYYSYNSIKINELRNQQIAAAQQAKLAAKEEKPANDVDETPVEQNFTSFDFAQTYKPDETYELKGQDSDLQSLDVEKAVSDLQKDKILEQYQYFVSDRPQVVATEMNPEERALRSGENFVL